jgi:predicted RNA-binding protein YlqC (UPF0109 family)
MDAKVKEFVDKHIKTLVDNKEDINSDIIRSINDAIISLETKLTENITDLELLAKN